MIYFLIFVLGLIFGSFFNVCIYRIPKNESILFPPSHCPNCGNRLKSIDLIPIFSFIFLRGKCRFCKGTISVRYPLVELLTGLLFLILFYKFGYSKEFLKYIVLSSLLIIISFIDLEHKLIPNILIFSGIIFSISYYALFGLDRLLDAFWGATIGSGFILLIIIFTKGMGMGDFFLFLMIGSFLGLRLTLLTLFLSFLLGGIAGILLIILGLKSRRDYVPFAPFISLATLLSILFGNDILRWYFWYIGF